MTETVDKDAPPADNRSMKPTASEMRSIKRLAEEKEVRAIIARDFSASRMSNTRWRQALWSLEGIPGERRVKFVDVEEPLAGFLRPATAPYFDGWWGPVLILSVEWFEIEPIERVSRGMLQEPKCINHGPDVERRLQEINVPYQRVEDSIRIIGHVRNAV